MRRVLSRLAPLGLGGLVILVVVSSGATADLPLDKLTEAAVRQRVAAALAADKGPETAALRELVNLDPAGIGYRPGSLTWRYQPKGNAPLIPEQRQGVENALRAVLGRALGQAPGMDNLRPEDLTVLLKSATFAPVAQLPLPKPAETGQPATTPAPPTPPTAPPAVSPEEVAKLRAALQKAEADRAEQAKKLADLAEQLKKLPGLEEQVKKLAAAEEALKKLGDEVRAAQDAARKARDDVKTVRDGAKQVGDDLKGMQDAVKKLDSQVTDAAKKQAEQGKAVSGEVAKLAARLDEEAKGRLADAKRLEGERKKLADQAADLKKASDQAAQELKRLAEQHAADLKAAREQLGEQVKKIGALVGAESDKLRAGVDEQIAKANAHLADETKKLNERIDDAFRKANARIDAESARLGQRLTGDEQKSALQLYRLDRRLNRLLEMLSAASPAPPPAARSADPCPPAPRVPATATPPPPPPPARGPAAGPGLRGLLRAPATVTVRLPAEARLYADGQLIPLTSSTRTFVTPPLEYGDIYKYTLRAEVGQGSDRRTLARTVAVEADKATNVDLNDVLRQPTAGGKPGSAGAAKASRTVVLDGLEMPSRKNDVIKAVQALTGLRGEEAARLVDLAPRPIRSYSDPEEAEAAAQKLRDAGAKVSVK